MQLNFSTAPSGNQPTVFTFDKMDVRVINKDGEPWFVAQDVCEALAHSDTSMAVRRLDEDEKGTSNVCTLSGIQEMLTINESGLYSLILTSRKPAAKRFKKWVTAEVLPSIRKTGSYTVGQPQPPVALPDFTNPAIAARAWAEQFEAKAQAQEQLAIAAPKAQALDRISQAEGEKCISDAAKAMQMQPSKLFDWMDENGWIFRRRGKWVAYQDKIHAGCLRHRVTLVELKNGATKEVDQVVVTPKGQTKLAQVAA